MMTKLYAAFVTIVLIATVAACATHTPEESASSVREAKAWYCGEGMMGIRAVARFGIALFTGTSIPNVCKVVDAVIEDDE